MRICLNIFKHVVKINTAKEKGGEKERGIKESVKLVIYMMQLEGG